MLWLLFGAPYAFALDGEAILEQVDRKMTPGSYEMYRKVINVLPNGNQREFVLYTIKKGRDKVANLFLSPPSEAGRVTLRLRETIWLSFPLVPQPIRISSLQSVVGGIFNNWDLMHAEFSTQFQVENAEEQAQEYILALKAKTSWVAYDRLTMRVDKESMLPISLEAYAASGLLIKTLNFRDVKDFGDGIVRPSVLETTSPLFAGHKAVMLFGQIARRDFGDEAFAPDSMSRIAELRKPQRGSTK